MRAASAKALLARTPLPRLYFPVETSGYPGLDHQVGVFFDQRFCDRIARCGGPAGINK
ncbi:MAG: hypothetical protein R2794_03085 [Chitinophagales bacterium]